MLRKQTEGRKMFVIVMLTFIVYTMIFILFEDYDRTSIRPLEEASDWHLLLFSLVVIVCLGVPLYRYTRRMDTRISRKQVEKENRMRRELTQNIAHELKTPVASILGYVETLLENPDIAVATQRQFVERTHSQAVRLAALLQDLSTLNRMEYAPEQLAMEQVNVSELFDGIVREMDESLKVHEVRIIKDLPKTLVVQGNAALLYSVFRNLMDNAVAYGGRAVCIRVAARQDGDCWHFVFSDNGVGVGEEHLSRLFERFYRIDKGRSRELGGTGLGLAIVKNAILLHGGTISVRNVVPHGLLFDFTLRRD